MTAPDLSQFHNHHNCVVCGKWGAFGYGPPLKALKSRWYCLAHRPQADEGGGAAARVVSPPPPPPSKQGRLL